jgi:predicted component of type VI protein secretion system
MTPAQRKYDIDLIASLRRMAQNIEPRSRQLSDTLKAAAERLDALSSQVPVEPGPNVAQDTPLDHQPASTPV